MAYRCPKRPSPIPSAYPARPQYENGARFIKKNYDKYNEIKIWGI